MPAFLYVETNFPLSYATGRSMGTDDILSNPSPSLRLIMPSVCFMEAFTLYEGELKRHNRQLDSIRQQLGEINRNLISPRIPSLADHWDQVLTETDFLFKEFKARLFRALEIIGLVAELIHPTPQILVASLSNILIEDPTDNLILSSILDHSKNHPSESRIFLSENRRDFDTNDRARHALRQAGVRFFADASKCLGWHRAQPES